MTQLKKCPCGQIPKELLISGSLLYLVDAYAECNYCKAWQVRFEIKGQPYTKESYAEAIKAWNAAPRAVTEAANGETCHICKWTNVSLINLGEPGYPKWTCQGCCKRMLDIIAPIKEKSGLAWIYEYKEGKP